MGPRIMQLRTHDCEWGVIKPMLADKPRGIGLHPRSEDTELGVLMEPEVDPWRDGSYPRSLDQPHSLKLEFAGKLPSLHDPPPAPSKHLTRCLRNRVQANTRVACPLASALMTPHSQSVSSYCMIRGPILDLESRPVRRDQQRTACPRLPANRTYGVHWGIDCE